MDLNLHLQLLLITNFEIFHSNKLHIQLEEPINLAQLKWKQCQISGSLGRLINSPLRDCFNFGSAEFELTLCESFRNKVHISYWYRNGSIKCHPRINTAF